MRITELWKRSSRPTLSFEVFPPRSPRAAEKFPANLEALAELRPDFISVTFGAGGSTREGSYQLVKTLREKFGLETMAYFACYGLAPDDIKPILAAYRDLGVENVLAVRGDPPKEINFVPHPKSLPHASDLVAYIRKRFNFCLGCAAYPESHPQSDSKQEDLEFLQFKVEQGADFIITNYCYDNAFFFDFLERCKAYDISVPILPGVMPVYSVRMMEMLAEICGATITEPLQTGIAKLPEGDMEALENFGVDFAVEQCRSILKAGSPGIHLYIMNRASSAVKIVSRLRAEGLFKVHTG